MIKVSISKRLGQTHACRIGYRQGAAEWTMIFGSDKERNGTVMKHYRSLMLAVLAGTALLAASPAWAAEPDGKKIATEGTSKGAVACMSCHGADGFGQPAAGFPRLARLDASYIAKQLHDFKNGTRKNPIMAPFASVLTDAEIKAVADYYAHLAPPAKPAEKAADTAQMKRGEEIAKRGIWSRGMPACFQCHGENGQGVPPHFPPIVGQSANYIAAQIKNWKAGTRANDPVGLMRAVSDKLKDDEIAAVAAYLASLAPQGAQKK